MKTARARELARELVRQCDIVSNNFTPGVMDRFGLGYDQVHALNPAAIYIAMSMQGDSGPERDYLGFGLTISALVGLHHLTALPGREPVGTGTNYPDHVPNPAHAAFAVLAALRHRRRAGRDGGPGDRGSPARLPRALPAPASPGNGRADLQPPALPVLRDR
jgi:benzylsuccinate CoA-transferase BbsF subunit